MPDIMLVDTDILIDVARGIQAAASFLEKNKVHYVLAISSVTEMELIVGCRNKEELTNLESFLSDYERIKINVGISDEAVKLLREFRLSHGLLIPDAFIAATAVIKKAELVTKNYKHYHFIPDLNLKRFT